MHRRLRTAEGHVLPSSLLSSWPSRFSSSYIQCLGFICPRLPPETDSQPIFNNVFEITANSDLTLMGPIELGSLMVSHSINPCAPIFELLATDFPTPPISTEEMGDAGLADPVLLGLHWKIRGPLQWRLRGALTYTVMQGQKVRVRWDCKSKEIWCKFQE